MYLRLEKSNNLNIDSEISTIYGSKDHLEVTDKSTIAIYTGELPPYVSEDLPQYGMIYKIVKSILEEMDIEYSISFLPWGRAENYIQNSQHSAIFPYIYTEKRAENFLFTDPLFQHDDSKLVLFYYTEDNDIYPDDFVDIAYLKTVQVGGLTDIFYVPHFQKNNIELDLTYDTVETFEKLINGRIDFLPSDYLSGQYIIDQHFPDRTDYFKTVPSPIKLGSTYGSRLMIAKDNPQALSFIKEFNLQLDKLIESGEYNQILSEFIDQ